MRTRMLSIVCGVLMSAACSSQAPGKAEEPMAPPAKAPEMAPAPGPMDHAAMAAGDPIALALSAGPADITANAAVVDMTESGEMKQLRAGTNGWVCMTHPDVMCVDREWQALFDAYVRKTKPQINGVGIAYMLRGDQGASNTDPFAMKETPGNQWIVSPPHIMVLTPDTKQLDALPTDFHAGGPWVMWKGTPYAHLMVPTQAMAMAAAQ